MKRDPALVSLSHQHHQALVVAQKLTRATAATRAAALETLNAYWSGHGRTHFRAEEEILFPAYVGHADPSDPLLAEALCGHAVIRQRIQALGHTPDPDLAALAELGRLLSEHIRLEERKLFPRIEAALPPEELVGLAETLEDAEAD